MPSRKQPAKKSAKKPAKVAAKKKTAPKRTAKQGPTTLTPVCAFKGASAAVMLYQDVFGAKVLTTFLAPDGSLAHGELAIGGSVLMLGEASDEGSHNMILGLRVPEVKAVWQRAIAAGCTVVFPLELQFYGDLSGRLKDPFGNQWILSTQVERVSEAEQQRRFQKMMRGEPWQ